MKHLEGKVFKLPPVDVIIKRAVKDVPAAFPICNYVYIKEVFQEQDQWWFKGIATNSNNSKGEILDRTVFLKYYDEVTDPAEIILYAPKS